MPKPTVPPSVGPHNGRELELMLQINGLVRGGTGYGRRHIGDAGFAPFVDEGRILKFTQIVPKTSVEER
ncbi:hypothetical protein NKI46_20345 [Mesorhizobium sp. M0615]|uniref:hypothetical protein n=1 Tax=Mesorhizobium sp. M0615 TaxID=2956971 RepID=UPI00333D1CA4